MAFDFLVNENVAAGLGNNPNASQVGTDNIDSSAIFPEKNLFLPYLFDPTTSWIAYGCWIETELDAGFSLHKPLPQRASAPDSLGGVDVANAAAINVALPAVNTISNASYQDIVQRMATPTYIFKLRGYALRAMYQIPIPGLVTVCGVTPTPAERQTGYNQLVGNCFGVPIFRARWDLWYYVTMPPQKLQAAPDNLAAHIGTFQTPQPNGLSAPVSSPDWNAVAAIPGQVQKVVGAAGQVQQVRQGG